MSEEVKSIFLDNTTLNTTKLVDHHLTGSWTTIFGEDNPNKNNDSIVGYWRLDDITGFDSSGNGNNITWTTDPEIVDEYSTFKFRKQTSKFDGTIKGDIADPGDGSLSFGDGTDDYPMSISCWVNLENLALSDAADIIRKANEYRLYLVNRTSEEGIEKYSISFQLYDNSSTDRIFEYILDTNSIQKNKWSNIVVTYNGDNSSSSSILKGINFYIDGVKKSEVSSSSGTAGTYVSMHSTTGDLTVCGSNLLEGKVAEIAIWNRELSQNEAKALYDLKYGVVSSLDSYTSYSPRLMLRDKDNTRGQYPTVKRNGDKDRSGSFSVKFNDLNTLIFNKIPTVYPGEKNKSFSITDSGTKYSYISQDNLVSHWRPQDAIIPTAAGTLWKTPTGGTVFVGGSVPIGGQAYIENKVNGYPVAYIEHFAEIYETDDPRYNSFTDRDEKIYEKRGSRNSYKYLFQDDEDDGLHIGADTFWDQEIGASGTNKMTLSAWVYPNSSGGGNFGRIFDFSGQDVALFINSSRQIIFNAQWSTAKLYGTTFTSIPLNEWTHVLVTYDSSDVLNDPIIYINGEQTGATRTAGSAAAPYLGISGNDCYVGNSSNLNRGWDGSIGDAAIWNSILDENEVKALYLNDTRWNPDISSDQEVRYPNGLINYDPHLSDITSDITSKGIVSRYNGGQIFNIITDPEEISAYNDLRTNTSDSSFFLTGTDRDVFPGFSSPLSSKTSFTFDITSDEDHYVLRQNSAVAGANGNDPINSDLVGNNFTGFSYFSFGKNKWEQIGLIQPEDGSSRTYEYGMDTTDYVPTFPQQFSGVSGFALYGNSKQTEESINVSAGPTDMLNATKETLGYDKIGLPTISSFAPFATQYHATSSQTLNTHNFISSPFLLEKISINIPIYARHAWTGQGDRTRDQSTYMVFLYLQKTPISENKSLSESVKSSRRVLIASSSMTFYNNQVLSDDRTGTGELIEFFPINNSTFQHKFDSSAATVAATTFLEFEGNVQLDFVPGICNPIGSNGSVPISNTVSSNYKDFWPGGNEVERFAIDSDGDGSPDGTYITGYENNSDILIKSILTLFGNWLEPYGVGAENNSLSKKIEKFSINKPPLRTITNYGSSIIEESDENTGGIASHTNYISVESYIQRSPFLLMPGDELILGIEKTMTGDRLGPGTSATTAPFTYQFGLSSQSSLSGSLLKIKNEPASMTFYGSLIRDNKEYHNTVNQDLTSNSIHEAFYGNNILDQFQIEPITMYSGSMKEEYVSGSFFEYDEDLSLTIGTREITKTVNNGNVDDQWSLTRFSNCYDSKERFYDTLLPSGKEILKSVGLIKIDDPEIDWSSGEFVDPDNSSSTLNYSDLEAGLHGIVDGTLDITLKDLGDGSHSDPPEVNETPWENTSDDHVPTNQNTYSVSINTENLFVDGTIANQIETHNYHIDDPNSGFDGANWNKGFKSKYQYGDSFVDRLIKNSSFPFNNNFKREDNENFTILTRLATEFGIYQESNWWLDSSGDDYSTSATGIADGPESFWHSAATAVGDVFGFGPTYETLDKTEVSNLLYRGKTNDLSTEDTSITAPPSTAAYRYNYGFNSSVSEYGDMSSFVYGVRNITPVTTNAVFRDNHYGQFRDMLEQRQYGRFVLNKTFFPKLNTNLNNGEDYNLNGSQNTSVITSGPVMITFVEKNSSNIVSSPDLTDSSNLNNHATSSLPFFDDLASWPSGRNRTYSTLSLNTSIISPVIDFDITV